MYIFNIIVTDNSIARKMIFKNLHEQQIAYFFKHNVLIYFFKEIFILYGSRKYGMISNPSGEKGNDIIFEIWYFCMLIYTNFSINNESYFRNSVDRARSNVMVYVINFV